MTPLAIIRRNVQSALSRGLTELQPQGRQLMPLTIIASGPSASQARLTSPVMALNQALTLFTTQGGAPTFWACCDAGPIVAEFLAAAPKSTTYFVASRCHPAVFEALADRKVVLWHLAERSTMDLLLNRFAVPSASSITICAFGLGHAMGFDRMETWGWDGCYMDGKPYAMDQQQSGVRAALAIPNGPRFETSGNWINELRDAKHVLERAPYSVKIHGVGMFDAVLRHNHIQQVAA